MGWFTINTADGRFRGRQGGAWVDLGAGGTVSSVALSMPALFTVSGSPVTSAGTLTATLAAQAANTVFAAPNGTPGAPAFRALAAADIPNHAHVGADITSGTVVDARIDGVIARDSEVMGIVLANDGTGSTLDADALDGLNSAALAILGGQAGGQTLRGGTAASENLSLDSTAHATKGNILVAGGGGNVGIGTTAPAEKLEVSRAIRVGNTAATNAGTLRWTGTNFEGYDGAAWKALDVQASSGGGWTEDSGLDKVYVTTGSRSVGIGTTAPLERLEVTGAIRVGSTAATNAGTIRWTGTNFEGYDGAAWKALDVQAASGGGWTEDAGLNKVYVTTGSRNVGIGTTTANNKLDIYASAADTGGLRLTRLTSASPAGPAGAKVLSVDVSGDVVLVADSGAGSGWSTTGNAGTSASTNYLGTSDAVDLVLRTNNAERMLIQSGGNVGIGSTVPGAKLDVAGNVSVSSAGAGLQIKEGANARMGAATLAGGTATVSTSAVTANSRIFLAGQNAGGTPGALYVSARTAGTSFTVTSTSGTDSSTLAWLIVEPVP